MPDYNRWGAKDFTLSNNTVNQLSTVANISIPRGEVFLLPGSKPIHLFLTARETVSHGGTGEETFTLTEGTIVDSDALADAQTAHAYIKSSGNETNGGITAINYADNEVTVDHNASEDLYIYFLFKEGNVEIDVVPAIASGNISFSFFDSAIELVHIANQFHSKGQIFYNEVNGKNGDVVPASILMPGTWQYQIKVNSSVTVYWDSKHAVDLIDIPYQTVQRKEYKSLEDKYGMSLEKLLMNKYAQIAG